MVVAVPGLTEAKSATATGASLTSVTVRLTVAVEIWPSPSVIVYVKLSGP